MTTARSAPRAPSGPRPWADTDRQASRPRGSVVRAERDGRRKGHQLQDAPEHGHRARARLSSASEPWTPETAVRRSSGPCVRADLAQVPTDMRPGRGVDGRADPRLVPSSMAAAPTGMAPLELSIVCPGVAQASLNLPTPSRSIEKKACPEYSGCSAMEHPSGQGGFMRARHLMLVTPLLGAGLVFGTVEAPQAAVNASATKTAASDAGRQGDPHSATQKKSSRAQYRAGYRQGFRDGRHDCRRSRSWGGGGNAWERGYNAGFRAGCAQVRRRPGGHRS